MKTIGKWLVRILLVILALLALIAAVVAVVFTQLDKSNGSIQSSGMRRTYLLHVPANLDLSKLVPLVISLHGFAEWPAHQIQISGWNDLADKQGFLVVYPSGTGFPKRWKAGGQPAGAADKWQDVTFISDLIDELQKQYNIDPARIYANGLSNGGGMAYLLGCTLSDRIAAVGSVAGAFVFPLEECQPARPVPMIAFHGTADPIVPYLGGPTRDFIFPSIPQWMAARAQINGCNAAPTQLPASGEASGVRYSGCLQEADVVFYSIQDGGHSWPGGEPLPEWIVGHTSKDILATRTMWEFFQQYSLNVKSK